MEMETKLQEIERRRIDEEAHRHAERDKFDDRVRQAHEAKETAEKEALVYKWVVVLSLADHFFIPSIVILHSWFLGRLLWQPSLYHVAENMGSSSW